MGLALGAIDHFDHYADCLVANLADCAAGFDVGAGDCAAAEGPGSDRVRLRGFVSRVVCRGLMQCDGGVLAAAGEHPQDLLLRRWLTVQWLATEAGCGRRILRWVALGRFNLPGPIGAQSLGLDRVEHGGVAQQCRPSLIRRLAGVAGSAVAGGAAAARRPSGTRLAWRR